MELQGNIDVKFSSSQSLHFLYLVYALVVASSLMPLVKIAFLVARFEHAPVLHHHAHSSREAQRQQQVLHRCRQHFRRFHFPAKLAEVFFLIRIVRVTRHGFSSVEHISL